MPRFLIRLRPNGAEKYIEEPSILKLMRKVYSFLDEEKIWSSSASSSDLGREVVKSLHDCLSILVGGGGGSSNNSSARLSCPMAFDSWSCWNETEAGSVEVIDCPRLEQFGYDGSRVATRQCQEDGSWWRHPDSNKTWSNYTQCPNLPRQQFRDAVTVLVLLGLVSSLVALGISLTLFLSFRSLRCGRIEMHKHLFASLAANNVLWIVWHFEVIFEPSVWPLNPVWCRVLNSVMTYFTISTYFWMSCEGVYLQILLSSNASASSFVFGCCCCSSSDSHVRKALVCLGWIGPAVVVAPYVALRAHSEIEDVNCWMDVVGSSQWLLTVPVTFLLLSNTVILVKVILVLRRKLREFPSGVSLSRTNSSPVITMKSVKAAFFLVPILGVHFLLLPVRPTEQFFESTYGYTYEVLSALLSAYQGLTVSILFCFLNAEVLALLRRQVRDLCGRVSKTAVTLGRRQGGGGGGRGGVVEEGQEVELELAPRGVCSAVARTGGEKTESFKSHADKEEQVADGLPRGT